MNVRVFSSESKVWVDHQVVWIRLEPEHLVRSHAAFGLDRPIRHTPSSRRRSPLHDDARQSRYSPWRAPSGASALPRSTGFRRARGSDSSSLIVLAPRWQCGVGLFTALANSSCRPPAYRWSIALRNSSSRSTLTPVRFGVEAFLLTGGGEHLIRHSPAVRALHRISTASITASRSAGSGHSTTTALSELLVPRVVSAPGWRWMAAGVSGGAGGAGAGSAGVSGGAGSVGTGGSTAGAGGTAAGGSPRASS